MTADVLPVDNMCKVYHLTFFFFFTSVVVVFYGRGLVPHVKNIFEEFENSDFKLRTQTHFSLWP